MYNDIFTQHETYLLIDHVVFEAQSFNLVWFGLVLAVLGVELGFLLSHTSSPFWFSLFFR
jgi:hypothetical protein